MSFTVQSGPLTESSDTPFWFYQTDGFTIVRIYGRTFYYTGYVGEPRSKSFFQGTDVMLWIGTTFMGGHDILNLTQKLIYHNRRRRVATDPIWEDIYPNPAGTVLAVLHKGGLGFVDIQNMEGRGLNPDPYENEHFLWMSCEGPTYPMDCAAEDSWKWQGDSIFTYIKPGAFDVKFRMGPGLKFSVMTQ